MVKVEQQKRKGQTDANSIVCKGILSLYLWGFDVSLFFPSLVYNVAMAQ